PNYSEWNIYSDWDNFVKCYLDAATCRDLRMTPVKRLRRPPAGGYARGDETRERIIDAAVKLFGERGFAAASTRDIATAAGVNAPALQYYFENKEGLYQACAEFIASDLT